MSYMEKEKKDFTEEFKSGKVNIRIENEEDIQKINDFCKKEGISVVNAEYEKVGSYVFSEDNKLWVADETVINEFEYYGNEIKVGFSEVEKYFTSEPSQEAANTKENRFAPMKDKEKQIVNLLKDKIEKLPSTKALNMLDHYANGFKEVLSKECISQINNIRKDYAKEKGIEVVNKTLNKNKDAER